MPTQVQTASREVVVVEDAHIRPMMGIEVLEPVPSARIPYSLLDPFVLVHEATGTRFMLMSGKPYGESPVFNGPYVD